MSILYQLRPQASNSYGYGLILQNSDTHYFAYVLHCQTMHTSKEYLSNKLLQTVNFISYVDSDSNRHFEEWSSSFNKLL